MKNASPNKQSAARRQISLRPSVNATTKSDKQRAEQITIPTQTLRDSEVRYRRLFEAAQDGIFILDAQTGEIDDVNPYLIDMLGYSRAEFVKKKLWEVGAFKDVDASKIAFKVLQENGYVRYENLPLRAKGGQLIQVEFVSNVYLAGGKIVIQCNIRNITDRIQAEEALGASKNHYRSLFENMLNGFAYCKMIFDQDRPQDFIYLEINSAFESLTGLKDVVGKKVSEVMPGIRESDPGLFEIYGRVALTGKPERFETYVEALKMWFSISVYSPQKEYFVAVFDVITERKQTEEALREREARYRGLFEDSPISLWEEDYSGVKQRLDTLRKEGITDFEEYFISHPEVVAECATLVKILDVNKATMSLFGANRKEDMLKSLAELFEGRPSQEYRDELVSIAAGKTSFDWEGINKTLDGRLININMNWSIAPGYENSLSRVIISLIDITKRRDSEERVRYQASLLENVNDAIVATDGQYRITSWNAAAESLYGWKEEEILGRIGIEITRPEWPGEDSESMIRRIAEIGSWRGEATHVRKDGTRFPVELSSLIRRDNDGNITGYISINRDITERKQSEERIQRQLEHLASLREIDQVIISSIDLRNSLTMILNQVTRELGVDAADVLLLNGTNLFLEYSAGVGFRTKAAEKASVRLGQNYAGRAALERQLIQIPDLKDQPDDFLLKTLLAGENFMCYFGVPLIAKGIIKGVLEVYHRAPLQPDQEWLAFLKTLADQAAIAIDNANLFDNLQRSNIDLTLAYDATIEGWSRAMDLRDKETEGHTLRVTRMTMELVGLFGIKDEELVGIRRGALLHDIGKMGVPDSILLKPAALTDEEWVIMRRHPTLALEMLSPIHYLKGSIDIPYCHHEKWDGTGYPRGLKGESIPLPARIFAVVDVWDALTSDRPYRQAWSKDKAIEYLRSQSGMHFDPNILKVCLESGVFDGKAPN